MIALAELLPELSQIVPVDRLSQQCSVDIRDAPKNVVTGPGPDPCALMAADDTHHVVNLTRRRRCRNRPKRDRGPVCGQSAA
jgi:hypothetical protein